MLRKIVIIALMVSGSISFLLNAQYSDSTERILNFQSQISIHDDGSMTVTETIAVVCAGDQIQRGIYRTFPTKYRDRFGNRIHVKFNVLEVRKNGQSEPYHTEKMSNGVKVYVGDKDVFLQHGVYTYTLVYQTDRQLGFFEDFDELYWNVTGSDWGFIIEHAEAIVHLPAGAHALNTFAYTGPQGAQGSDYSLSTDGYGNPKFTATKPLNSYEGFTIAISFPKGFVPEPTVTEKAGYIFTDNASAIVSVVGLLVLLMYYLIVWLKVGKDPEKGVIVPLFSPPQGYSPAAIRYVLKMGYSNRVFAAAIVNMAVKGYLKIEEEDGEFTLTRIGNDESVLSKGERRIAQKLLLYNKRIVLESSNHLKISNAIKALKKSLKLDFEKIHFRTNSSYLIPGSVITILILFGIILTAPEKAGAAFMTIWLSGWTAGCFALVFGVIKAWQMALSKEGGIGAIKKAGALGMTVFALPFIGGELVGLYAFASFASPIAAIGLLVNLGISLLFYQLLKAPTIHGRKVMDQIEGFKMYLEVAEENRLNFLHPPEKTPQLFEKYLPYALALGVENAWTEKFSDVLSQSIQGRDYSPAWYSGKNWSSLGATNFANSLGSSFSSAISSSSSAPGSRSGSSGGGSSGGGGGGGGGGGW